MCCVLRSMTLVTWAASSTTRFMVAMCSLVADSPMSRDFISIVSTIEMVTRRIPMARVPYRPKSDRR